jgi:hypothetical protein
MEKSSKRGKIPQQDWPSIIKRYEAGETLASIARTYDCSPPAISYIVSRTRARSAAAEPAIPKPVALAEPQLLKALTPPASINSRSANESLHNGALGAQGATSTIPVDDSTETERLTSAMTPSELFPGQPVLPKAGESQRSPEINRPAQRYGQERRGDQEQREFHAGAQAAAALPVTGRSGGPPEKGEARRTLHLSLSQGNGSEPSDDSHPTAQNADNYSSGFDNRPVARSQQDQSGSAQQPRQAPASGHALPFGPAPSPMGAVRGPTPVGEAHRPGPRDGGVFIDHALRERIDGDIAAFLTAFDAALDHDTAESRTGLREATDRLLRAGARTRIELERLEARVPLASRDKDSQTSSPFRPR